MPRPVGHQPGCHCPVCSRMDAEGVISVAAILAQSEQSEGGEDVGVGRGGWIDTTPTQTVMVETGRGNAVAVQVGAPFRETVERIAEAAHYGGSFRVYLNAEEVIEPGEAPTSIQPGMRIAITAYDKVGK